MLWSAFGERSSITRDLTAETGEEHEASDTAARRFRRRIIDEQRREGIRLRDRGLISDNALHRIEHDLDLEEVLLESQE